MSINSLGFNPTPIKRPENVEVIKRHYLDKLFDGCDAKESLKEAAHAVCDIYVDKFCLQEGITEQEEINENELPKPKGAKDLQTGFFFIDDLTQFFESILKK